MEQDTFTSGYRQPAPPPKEKIIESAKKKITILSPKFKVSLAKIGTSLLGLAFIFLAFPGMTYLGRALWPFLFGHSIWEVKDGGVHYICAWCLGVCTILSPLLTYFGGKAFMFLGHKMGSLILEAMGEVKKWIR
jgi:hypothetical protein